MKVEIETGKISIRIKKRKQEISFRLIYHRNNKINDNKQTSKQDSLKLEGKKRKEEEENNWKAILQCCVLQVTSKNACECFCRTFDREN